MMLSCDTQRCHIEHHKNIGCRCQKEQNEDINYDAPSSLEDTNRDSRW
jgi:hypothetical protein